MSVCGAHKRVVTTPGGWKEKASARKTCRGKKIYHYKSNNQAAFHQFYQKPQKQSAWEETAKFALMPQRSACLPSKLRL